MSRSKQSSSFNKKVFVSYRRRSWPFTHRLTDRLRDLLDAEIFIDYKGIDDTDFERSILRHLRNSDVFLLIVSEDTFNSEAIHRDKDWVRREIRLALKLDKPIILVLIDGLTPPPPEMLPQDIQAVANRQGIRFFPEFFNEGVDKLADFIQRTTTVQKRPNRLRRSLYYIKIISIMFVTVYIIIVIANALRSYSVENSNNLSDKNETHSLLVPVHLIYDDATFSMINEGASTIVTQDLIFVRGDNDGYDDFSGDRIARDILPSGKCYQISIQGTNPTIPEKCSPITEKQHGMELLQISNRLHWRRETPDGSAIEYFEIYYGGQLITRCDTVGSQESGECRFNLPTSVPSN